MDLAELDLTKAANVGAWVDILHPVTGEALDIKILVIGKDSDKFRELEEKHQRESLEAAKRTQKLEDRIAAAKAQGEALLVACTVQWQHVELDGVELDCTPENVRKVYSRFTWLRDQVDVAIGTRANFLKR